MRSSTVLFPPLPPPRPRRGVALILVLVALSVLGALTAGTFFVAWRDLGAGTRSVHRARAFSAAEFGLLVTLAAWDARWTAAPPGLVAFQSRALDDRASDTVRVWKLASSSAMIVSQGVAVESRYAAQRRLSLLIALRPLAVTVPAALIARDGVVLRGGSQVLGASAAGSDDGCDPDSSRAAVAVPDTVVVDTAQCGVAPCLAGNPAILITPLAGSPNLAASVGIDRDALAARAISVGATAITPRPSLNAVGACDLSDPLNFGDPAPALGTPPPCVRWAAPRYASGNLRLDGGVGQGLLMVDGNLTLAGGARFAGIALVRGTLRIEGASRLDGAVAAARAVLDDGSTVRYAPCAVDRARRGAAQPAREAGLSWVEQY